MTIPKEIIENAIAGGWHEGYKLAYMLDDGSVLLVKTPRSIALVAAEVALDPLFWQALGKSLGWPSKYPEFDPGIMFANVWQDKAHHFYSLILTNGDTDTFWQSLLTHQQK